MTSDDAPGAAETQKPWTAVFARLLRDTVPGQKAWYGVAATCMLFVAATTAGLAWLMEPVLDEVFLERDERMLVVVPLAVTALAIVKSLAMYGQAFAMERIGHRIVADMQKRLYAHILGADVGYFAANAPGGLVSRLTYDANLLRIAVTQTLAALVRDSTSALFLAALMFHQEWRLAIVALIGFPLALYPISRLSRRLRKVSGQSQEQMGLITSRLEETFKGVRQVKAYGREADESERVGSLLETMFELQVKAARSRSVASPVMEGLAGLAIAAVVFYGGSRVLAGETTPGAFFSFVTAMILVYKPVKSLARMHVAMQDAVTAAQRIYDVLDIEPAVRDAPGARDLPDGPGAIRFSSVSFGYAGDRSALSGFDLDVAAGETVALVGPSGGGKSTVLNLLLRFWDPDRGAITIDGADLRAITLSSLRSRIALVSQDVVIFDDTIAANIAYGRRGATREQIERASDAAAVSGFVAELPEGLDTQVGSGGVRLSGGQRQRIAIARAVLRDAPVLLMDEATSALDAASERRIQSALDRLREGRTTLVVAHRLSTIRGADRIVVLEAGRIVEQGGHDALMAKGGAYAELWRLQDRARPIVEGSSW